MSLLCNIVWGGVAGNDVGISMIRINRKTDHLESNINAEIF